MSSYTRCPHCDTAFVVTEDQLQVADGNVRCGSCKSVFNAREFMMDLPVSREPTIVIEDEAVEAKEEEQILLLEESALDQIYDDPETIQASGEAKVDVIASDPLDEDAYASVSLNNEAPSPASDIEVREHAESPDYVQIDMIVESEVAQPTEVELPEGAIMEIKDDADLFAESLENLQLTETDPEAREVIVDNFTQHEVYPLKLLQKLSWGFGSLVLLVAVVIVILWIKRFDLAQDDNWRPTLDEVCKTLDCGISPRRNINKIQLQNREVSYGEGSITVNMLLINSANFEQAYPSVEVSFYDLNGNTLTTHLVLPVEYLRIDLIDSLMPTNVPVHIEFILEADTQSAVGYEFKFL